MPGPDLKQTLDKLSSTLEKSATRGRRAPIEVPMTREERKAERRAKRREEARENASVAGGAVALVIAAAMVIFAVTRWQFWWLLFVAFGIGSSGAQQIALARERDGKAATALPAADTKHEIDGLCDQLLADLEASPEAVRSFLQEPERTIEALRVTAKAVDQRRRDLVGEGAAVQLAALSKQREELRGRRDAASDVDARNRFDGALRSLDGQEAALRQLTAVSERLDGEYTSLLVLLQEMKTRVAVARSTTSDAQLEGLQQNVQRLNAELQAITDSLVMAPIDESLGSGEVVPSLGEKVR